MAAHGPEDVVVVSVCVRVSVETRPLPSSLVVLVSVTTSLRPALTVVVLVTTTVVRVPSPLVVIDVLVSTFFDVADMLPVFSATESSDERFEFG